MNHRGAHADGRSARAGSEDQAAVAREAARPVVGVVRTRAADHCGQRTRREHARLARHVTYRAGGREASVFLRAFLSVVVLKYT